MCNDSKKGIRKISFPLFSGDLSVFDANMPTNYHLKEYLKGIQKDLGGYVQVILETDGLKYVFINEDKFVVNGLLYDLDYREVITAISRLEKFEREELNTKAKVSKLSLTLKEIEYDEVYPLEEMLAILRSGKLCVIETRNNCYVILPQSNYVAS